MAPAETQLTKTMTAPGPDGSMRRAGERFAPHNTPRGDRLENDVAQEGARRIGTLAILTAVTVLGIAVLQGLLQPELAAHRTPLFRLSALFLVLSSAGLAALQRSNVCSPQVLLNLGLLFEVTGALALGLIENSIHWSNAPLGRSTAVGGWIAVWVMVVPSRPWKSVTAAFLSAAMLPSAHLLAARILGNPPASWNLVASYSLVVFFVEPRSRLRQLSPRDHAGARRYGRGMARQSQASAARCRRETRAPRPPHRT